MVNVNNTVPAATMDTIPAVAYLRRSTDRQEQSIGDQRSEITRWASVNGYALVGEYLDDAISGTSAESRPGFQSMVADARTGRFKVVIVWNSDRFSRGDVTETEHHRYLLRKAGVKVLSVTEDYLAREGIDGDVLRTVRQFQNRQYSISLSQNTLRGQISAVKGESDPGRPAPYGYDREIVGPDGSVLYRVRFCPGHVREADAKVKALLLHIEPENLPLINDRLSQLRRRKEHLEKELTAAKAEAAKLDADALRRWVRQRITGLADALAGKRDERTRQVLSSYITSLRLTPGKSGKLVVNPGAWRASNDRTRPRGRVREGEVAGAKSLPLHAMRKAFWQKFRPAA